VLREFVAELLTALELQETRLLSWGFYDVGFSEEEIEALLSSSGAKGLREFWSQVQQRGIRLRRLLDDLVYAGLLYRPVENPELIRTRFAEDVRLLARLRQLFRSEDWSTGPQLVADVKIHLNPRRYPKRELPGTAVWAALALIASQPNLQKRVFENLSVDSQGRSLTFSGFQVRAFSRILQYYGTSGGMTGTVVCAGTGSGKTKAFYVPAFLGIASDLSQDKRHFSKVISLYPRNVLLADQLREAIAEAEKVRPSLESCGSRPITFGALLGDTPPAGAFESRESVFLRNWKRTPQGWIVPFVKSPRDGQSSLVWRDADRKAGRTALFRADGSNSQPDVPDGILRLTRDAIQNEPPDVLLLSIEMFNRELCNPDWSRAFGIGTGVPCPRLLLLDEVHTYEGLSGAQIPWILRRWIFAARPAGLHVVGLSATLRDAVGHLSAMTGAPIGNVQEVGPISDDDPDRSEVISEGIEYNIALKGHPGSGASLLATSIQSAMLLSRLLTADDAPRAGTEDRPEGDYYFARRVFGFTDNLDSLNRWIADLRDAETNGRLARFRVPPAGLSASALLQMDREGQVWNLPQRLGHDLAQALSISRCSSQDPGVSVSSRVVLATSSLEVGYDDPEVGIVLHHKMPRSMASFIQRRGRAGRRRGTRPMTVVVLSDFGRDRWAFRDSEQLFGNEIDAIRLPVLNPYVLKIQSALFLIDWIGRKVGRPSPFRYLGRESGDPAACVAAKQLLEGILGRGVEWERFRQDFGEWLTLSLRTTGQGLDTEILADSILWDSPRPLLRHVVPSLLRRLERNFRHANLSIKGDEGGTGASRPIPEYIPSATFAELDAREVEVRFPGANKEPTSLGVDQVLSEVCPGRISKRFSVGAGERGYWLPISARLVGVAEETSIGVDLLFPERLFVREIGGLMVYQPLSLELVQRPTQIKDSSQGRWDSQFYAEPVGEGSALAVFEGGPWMGVFNSKRVYLHRNGDGLRTLRYASTGRYEILGARRQVTRGIFRLESQNSDPPVIREAIGFEKQADGIVFEVSQQHLGQVPTIRPDAMARLRPDFYLALLLRSEVLQCRANPFSIALLGQTSLAMLCATALKHRCPLAEAQSMLKDGRVAAADAVVTRFFGSLSDGDDAHPGKPGRSRRHQELLDLWSDPEVLSTIEMCERVLWEDPDDVFVAWLRKRYIHTLSTAILVAVAGVLVEVPEEDLSVEVTDEEEKTQIFLTETVSGGLGHIEALVARMASEPAMFGDALRASFERCDRDAVARTILDIVDRVSRGPYKQMLSDAFGRLRGSQTFDDLFAAKDQLRLSIRETGLDASRAIVSPLVAKVLKPGSSRATDRWTRGLNSLWRKKSAELRIAIDPAVFSYWCSERAFLRRRLDRYLRQLSGQAPTDNQMFIAFGNFLHDTCEDSCPECLGTGDFGFTSNRPSRDLARRWLGFDAEQRILAIGDSDAWLAQVRAALAVESRVTLEVVAMDMPAVARALHRLFVEDIEREYLFIPVSIGGISRRGSSWDVVLQLRGVDEA
jgi:Helicase conserved C-terminal domain